MSNPAVQWWHDDVIKWKHFPRHWPFVRGIHRSPVNFPHKGQSRGALIFSLICAWINGWVNNREAGDLRHHRAHYDVIIMNFPALIGCVQRVWTVRLCQSVSDGWVMTEWLARWTQLWVMYRFLWDSGAPRLRLVSYLWSNSLLVGIYHWCCQCTGICFHVSPYKLISILQQSKIRFSPWTDDSSCVNLYKQ